jgi:predicted nuclease of restriction endonuclease-like RecB superfamily
MAVAVLRALVAKGRVRPSGELPPSRVRASLFAEAARAPSERCAIVEDVARSFRVSQEEIEASLFADLPGQRAVIAAPEGLSPGELALRANLALAQALLFRSTQVRIALEGNARVVVRHARLRGLICLVRSGELELSGPLALFRRTLLYGRALGELLPLLAWCRRFRLVAECVLRQRPFTLKLASGDPIFPSLEPRRYDSRVEERFAREFSRLATDWDLVREPEPVEADGTLVFPDFALTNRSDPAHRWLLEIVGFWTPGYVESKLERYRAARLSNLILCIDEERRCADGNLPAGAIVIPFRRRVDPEAVLRALG